MNNFHPKNQKKEQLLLFFLMLMILSYTASWEVFSYPPRSVHQWRQSDCAAYVKTYYREGRSLLQPATFNLAGKEGKVISEFPVLYYIAAKLGYIFGEHYWIIRGLTFLSYLLGLGALLKISLDRVPNRLLAFTPVLLLATSPYYYYYAINFLPNVPAIAISLIGLCFMLQFEKSRKNIDMILSTVFIIMATALKPTDGGMLWLAYLSARLVLRAIGPANYRSATLRPLLIASAFIIACIVAWTRYVNWYNDLNGNHQNLIGIYPIWSMDKDLIRYTANRILLEWSNVFQQKIVILFWLAGGLLYMLRWKRLDPLFKWLSLFLCMGTLAYMVLWFKAFTDHDYYQLVYVLPAVFVMITALEYTARTWSSRSIFTKIAYPAFLIMIVISIYHNRNIQQERYSKPDYVYGNPAIFELEPYLAKMGIPSTAAVVCVPDKSPNISLNAINHYGYTEEFNGENYNIRTFQRQGAAYLIISDSSYLEKELYKPFLSKPLGRYKGIYVFDIREQGK